MAQNITTPLHRGFRIGKRIVARGRLGQSGKHRLFRECQFLQRLSIINPCRGREAIGPVTQEYFVYIELEDFLFAQFTFNLEGQ